MQIDIAKINQRNAQEAATEAPTGNAADSLDKLLESYLFSEVPIDNEVNIIFPEEDSSMQNSGSELTNTDEEDRLVNDQEANKSMGALCT